MTAPRVVRLGSPRTVTAVNIGPAGAVGGASKLDDLTDVDGAELAPTGAVLVKESDGVYRGQLGGPGSTEQVDWFTGEGPPPALIPGAGPGDFYVDSTTGWLYRLQ